MDTGDRHPHPAVGARLPRGRAVGVRRRFGEVDALAGLDLEVPANRITVLLGPNGAGKTTAIRMITGALDPHAGRVRTFGLDPSVHGEQVRRRCGVVSAKPALYDRLSATPTSPTPPSSTAWAGATRSTGASARRRPASASSTRSTSGWAGSPPA